MLKVTQPGLLDADLNSSVNLFLGAGFSTLASANINGLSQQLPTGTDLKSLLIKKFERPELEALDLQSVYTVISSERRIELDTYLSQMFTVDKWDPKYRHLRSLFITHVFTTNIDDLCFNIFSPVPGETSPVFYDVISSGQPRDTSAAIQYVPLHGCVRHDPPNFLFTAGQISSAFVSDQQTWYVFQRELQVRPTFFLGYGMNDAGVLQALHNSSLDQGRRWILLRQENTASVLLYESLGFNVLIGSISDFFDYLSQRQSAVGKELSTRQRSKIGRIPSRDEVAQRPVREFFLGAEPSWSDAFSRQVPRRRVNGRVLDAILSGKNVALVGLPLSGKSTILRQVAVDLVESRSCIFIEKLTVELADEIIAEHLESTTKPIVILDQFIDSRDGFNKLVAAGGFKFVVVESSVYFDSINVRRLTVQLNVVPCSEVERPDLQRIIDAIPVDIKRQNINAEFTEDDIEYRGLFEGLVTQVYDKELTRRFQARLAEFEAKDQQAFDVYIMACYVNQCRTLVSYDMMYMFLESNRYDEGYKVAARIQQFIREREDVDDPHQDHFSVRSTALARIAYKSPTEN